MIKIVIFSVVLIYSKKKYFDGELSYKHSISRESKKT